MVLSHPLCGFVGYIADDSVAVLSPEHTFGTVLFPSLSSHDSDGYRKTTGIRFNFCMFNMTTVVRLNPFDGSLRGDDGTVEGGLLSFKADISVLNRLLEPPLISLALVILCAVVAKKG